jgi:hypothetical protein
MNFEPENNYPREIFFGDELSYSGDDNGRLHDWDIEKMVTTGEKAPCDNSGVITIKGMSYAVDFRK